MYIEPQKLAFMFFASAVCGVMLELFWETLGLLGCAMRYRRGCIMPWRENTAALVMLFIKDVFFFTTAGTITAVLIYWTNDGEPRYLTFAGILIGFVLFHRTLGRLIRRLNKKIVILLFRVIGIFLYPLRLLQKQLIKYFGFIRQRLGHYRMYRHTLRCIRELEVVKKFGMPSKKYG